MASKKKPNRPRPPTPPRPAAKPAVKPPGGRGPSRAERLAAAEKARRRKSVRTRALVAVGIVGLVVFITVTAVASRRSNDRTVALLQDGGCKYDTKTDTDGGAGRNHLAGDLKYDTDPPAGGNHNQTAAGPGVFTAETRPPDSQIVHALEHGYVVLWYRPDVAGQALDDLKALAGRHGRDVLVVPRESLRQPVAATAWHRRLQCPQSDLRALETFVTTYVNRGPEKIPH